MIPEILKILMDILKISKSIKIVESIKILKISDISKMIVKRVKSLSDAAAKIIILNKEIVVYCQTLIMH